MKVRVRDITDKIYEAHIRISTFVEGDCIYIYDEDVDVFEWTDDIPEEILDKEVTDIYAYDSCYPCQFKVIELVVR